MYNDPIITYKATRLTVSLILYSLSRRSFLLIRIFHAMWVSYDVGNDYGSFNRSIKQPFSAVFE